MKPYKEILSSESSNLKDSPMSESHKRALVVAYFLSKYDRKGCHNLGFKSFEEAFKQIGKMLDVKQSTVKHMRDSFDPYCSRVRVGWYQREILPSRANVIQAYDELSETAMTEIAKAILGEDSGEIKSIIAPVTSKKKENKLLLSDESPFATRLRTGEKAESFFIEQFSRLDVFVGSNLEDVRRLGIGFDFRTNFRSKYYAVEVKGIVEDRGYVSFTDKEWSVAKILGENYFVALVRNLNTRPNLDLINSPATKIAVEMKTIQSVSICWNARV